MIDVIEEIGWKVGQVVLVYLPYDRMEKGKIDKITDKGIHVMVQGHIMSFDKDGQDHYNKGSIYGQSIKIPTREEIKRYYNYVRRKRLLNFDFKSLTDEHVKGIIKQMKSLGINI